MKQRNPVKTNPRIKQLVQTLTKTSKAQKAEIWKTVAQSLDKPAQNWAEVNIGDLERLTKGNETVLVAGKVLGAGTLTHAVHVYAFNSSPGAKKLIESAKGKLG